MRTLVNALRMDAQEGSSQERAKQALLAAGSLLGALGASACCIAPLVLFSFGISGAWIGTLVSLKPYQPVFVAVALGFVGYGYWWIYRRTKAACAGGEVCARPLPSLVMRVSLWSATVLVAASVAYPYVAPYLLGL